jgi:hypothetical protein
VARFFAELPPRPVEQQTTFGSARRPRHGPQLSFVVVSELSQGGIDLTGDGDALDEVAHLHRAGQSSVTNLGIPTRSRAWPWPQVSGGTATFAATEVDLGRDVNDDGDPVDTVLFIASRHGVVTSTLATASATIGKRWVACGISERSEGRRDLNGDGDIWDVVLHWVDSRTGAAINSGLALGVDGSQVVEPRAHEDRMAFAVAEASQGGSDLNGDGDASDLVLHLSGADGRGVRNLGLAVRPTWAELDVVLHGRHVLIGGDETAQGAGDLNGDGDASDTALHWFDGSRLRNLGLALVTVPHLQVDRSGRALFSVLEGAHGAADLNGDGDSRDRVAHVLSLGSGQITNTRLAAAGIFPGAQGTLLSVYEYEQGFVDLDGDGVPAGYAGFMLQAPDLITQNLSLPVQFVARAGVSFLATRYELDVDLNGDGGLGDEVIFLVRPPDRSN